MGDAVLDQHVREYIVLKLQSKPHRLHQVSKSYVSAKSQAKTLEYLLNQIINKLYINCLKQYKYVGSRESIGAFV